MKTTNEFLDAVKTLHGLQSDYALAKLLGVRQGSISHYRSGRSSMDTKMAVKVAELLALKPLEVIATVEIERARDEKTKGFWMRYAAALFVVVGVSAPPSPAEAAAPGNVYYVKSQRRRRVAVDTIKAAVRQLLRIRTFCML